MNAVPEIMEPTSFDGLEDRFGSPFVSALRNTLESGVEETDAVQVWGRAMAKDQFSKVVTRALEGKCQIVRTRSKDPVLVMSLQHLATFVGQAATLRRFASMIIQEPEGEFGRRFGAQFIIALRRMMDEGDEEPVEFKPWGIAEAKGHFREMLDRAIQGECQLVRRRSSEPVLLASIAQLAAFAQQAPKKRFADLIAHDPELPVGSPLEISEAAVGTDEIEI